MLHHPLLFSDVKSVRELIYKRGYGEVDRQCVPLAERRH